LVKFDCSQIISIILVVEVIEDSASFYKMDCFKSKIFFLTVALIYHRNNVFDDLAIIKIYTFL